MPSHTTDDFLPCNTALLVTVDALLSDGLSRTYSSDHLENFLQVLNWESFASVLNGSALKQHGSFYGDITQFRF